MRAYERLLKYVTVHTTSSETSGIHPSFAGEFDLARALVKEMQALGIRDAFVDEHCYVYGSLPASDGMESVPALAFIAHMDTSEAASGENVHPVLHEHYDGKDVVLPGSGAVMKVKDFPALAEKKGELLITSDGTTLLGADDKAGIAEILTAAETLILEDVKHGALYFCFTPDEEIGEGTDFFSFEHCPAAFGYTVDGGESNCLEYENFNAASAKLTVTGFSVHPGSAKNTMKNALQIAMELHALLPENERPEHTEGYEGFFHLTGMSGECGEAKMQYIIRDHDRESFEARKETMQEAVRRINARCGEGTVQLELRDSYYNMREKIEPHRHLIDNALAAIREAGMEPETVPIRGGTDGARLSYEGMPCPNLGTGGHNFHGNFEWITAESMDRAVSVILNIIRLYSGF